MVARHVSNRRLLKLADFLATEVKNEKFDLGSWAELEANTLAHGCGTTACAVGWACSIPSFRKAGLKLARYEYSAPDNENHVIMMLHYRNKEHFGAAEEFFGVTGNESHFLFDSNFYGNGSKSDGTKRAVIKRIREFVRDRDKSED